MQKNFSHEEALEIIFDQMMKQGLVTPEMEARKQDIIANVAEQLKNEPQLTMADLMNNKVKKTLIGAIISETLGLKQNRDEFLHTLKNEREHGLTDEPNPELDKKLEHGLNLLTLLHQLDKTPKLRPENFLREWEDKLLEKEDPKDEKKKEKIAQEVSEYEKQITECLRNLYGGDDPRVSGEIPSVIIGPIVGNLYGFTCQGAADPNSTALMIEQITYNEGKADPLGLENLARLNDEALGCILDDIDTVAKRPRLTH